MTESSRKKLLLGMLGALLAIFAWKQLPELSSRESEAQIEAGPASRPRRGRRGRRSREVVQPKEVRELMLSSLDPEPGSYTLGRNLWAFYTPPAPPPPPPPLVRPPVFVPPPHVDKEPVVDETPRPPTIRFKYLGSFGPKNRKIAVLAEEENLVNALEGDVVMKNFRVAKIGFESVYIEYVDFPDAEAAQLKVGG